MTKDITIDTNNNQAHRASGMYGTNGPTIWTPQFCIVFFLLCTFGASIASLVAHTWANGGSFAPERVYMIYAAVLFCVWLLVIIRARNGWTRLGVIFGCIWASASIGHFWLLNHAITFQADIVTQTRMVENSALLACFLCLMIAHVPFGRWDTLFFWLIPLALCAFLALSYLRTPADARSLLAIEGKVISLTIYLSIIVWWLRLANWRDQPGLIWLFGLAPILLYFLTRSGDAATETHIFMQQIFFLLIFLGALRILQQEKIVGGKRQARG